MEANGCVVGLLLVVWGVAYFYSVQGQITQLGILYSTNKVHPAA